MENMAAAERRFAREPELGYLSVLPAVGTAAEAEAAVAAELRSGNLNTNPSGGVFPGHASATAELSFVQAHVAPPPLEHGEPSVFQAFYTNTEAGRSVSAVRYARNAAAAEQGEPSLFPAFGANAEPVTAALRMGSIINSYPAAVIFPSYEAAAAAAAAHGVPSLFPDFGTNAEAVNASLRMAGIINSYPAAASFHSYEAAAAAHGELSGFPDFGTNAEAVNSALRTGGIINNYPAAAVSFPGPGHAPPTEWAYAQGSRSVMPRTAWDTALQTGTLNSHLAGVGLPNAQGHGRSTPFFQDPDRVEIYNGENEELDQLHALGVQVEQLGPNDLQDCLRQGDSDRALDILALMVHEGKAKNGAVDIEADERDINRAHPKLVILLRGHGYFSIRKRGDIRRAESYYRNKIRGVYPDGVSTGNPFVDTLRSQLETIARTERLLSENHLFGDTNETQRWVNDYLKVYFPEYRNEVEEGRTRLGLFGEKEGKRVRCLACHKEFKGYNCSKLRYHQLRDPSGKQALCQASTAYIRQQILEAD